MPRILGFARLAGTEPTLAERKAALRAAAAAEGSRRREMVGYPHDFGGAIGVKVLQTRQQDEANWLAAAVTAQILIGMGAGDQPQPPGIRTADNAIIAATASQTLAVMLALQAHVAGIMARVWALKDATDAAADHAALDQIDVTEGWPN